MPTYDYICSQCHSRFELSHPVRECDQPHLCRVCGAPMTRQVSFPTIYMPGRYYGKRDGWWDYVFPKMESVRSEDRKFKGV